MSHATAHVTQDPHRANALDWCAIDFGTSNSAVSVATAEGMTLVPLENGQVHMPTATFYLSEGRDLHSLPRLHGRAALAAYVEGSEGRLMRSMKSVLGSALMTQHTDIGAGRSVSFADVIAGYLRHLRQLAEPFAAARGGQPLRRVVLGRPVYFVDEDPERDAQAQASLEAAALAAGFEEVVFQYEPLAAAFDHEARLTENQRVLVADIGGGTSDFSIVQVGPAHRQAQDRRADVLGHHGIHIAGTDFDRRVSLGTVMPELGFGALGPAQPGQAAREVPSRVYFDLATWHLINTLYRPQRVQELRAMRGDYADGRHHARLMSVITEHLGHDVLSRAEQAKIHVAGGGQTQIDLNWVERGLQVPVDVTQVQQALRDDVGRIVAAAQETVRRAGLRADQIDALYFTGGSTGLRLLTDELSAAFPQAQSLQGERMASVAGGLGVYASRLWGE